MTVILGVKISFLLIRVLPSFHSPIIQLAHMSLLGPPLFNTVFGDFSIPRKSVTHPILFVADLGILLRFAIIGVVVLHHTLVARSFLRGGLVLSVTIHLFIFGVSSLLDYQSILGATPLGREPRTAVGVVFEGVDFF